MRFLLLIFIIIPLMEMLLLFEVADIIGGFSTLGMVVLTAVIGVQILKRQGLSTLSRANQRLQSGELPAQEIVEGMLLAGAGALLLTPGFITDCLGFIFLTLSATLSVKSGLSILNNISGLNFIISSTVLFILFLIFKILNKTLVNPI